MNLGKLAEELRQLVDGSERMHEYEVRLASDHCSVIAAALELGQKAVEALKAQEALDRFARTPYASMNNVAMHELAFDANNKRHEVLAEAEAE
jgi:hypothetical protein